MLYKILSNTKTYLALAIVLSAAAAITVGFYTYRGARAVEERALIERAEIVALSLDARELTFLAGNESDLENPFYQSLKGRLRKVKEVNADVSYIYLAGLRHDNIFFYVDAGAVGSDESPPGQVYEEASDVFKETFVTALPRFEGPLRDRWGNWISAFVPITNPKSGEVIAVLGMDVSALEYQKRIALSMATPIFLIVALFLLFLVEYMRYKKGQEMLALKAEFLSVASHDLRAPLTGVLWALQLFKKSRDAMTESPTETLGKIEITLRRMLASLQGVLDASQSARALDYSKAKEVADVIQIVDEVIESLDFAAKERNITIFLEEDFPKTLAVKAASLNLRHIFSNLISNAIKYSRPGGEVAIRCSEEGNKAVLSVEDEGLGIPERDQKKIFTEYFRGSNAGDATQNGTGLGLYLTKRLAREFDGKIWFVSQENVGTKFYIEIPLS